MINGLLSRLTGAPISDFGCAFNAYRRDAIEPVMHRIGRQKFTKALVCSTGARVTEVDLAHAARGDHSRYGLLQLIKLALHVLTGFWAQMVQWVGADSGDRRYPDVRVVASGAPSSGSGTATSPVRCCLAGWCCSCSACRDS